MIQRLISRWDRECIAKAGLQRGRVGQPESSGIMKVTFLNEKCQLLALISYDGLLVLMR